MKQELELKHLAVYLPYELKFMMLSEPESKEPNIDELKSLDTGLKMVNFGWGNAKNLTEIKPLLRSMNDLTKEIECNGAKIIPIIELAKIQYPKVEFEISENLCLGRLNIGVTMLFEIIDYNCFYKEIHNNIFGQISGNEWDDMFMANINPLELLNKLFEWHFDVFGLIDKGFAVKVG